MNALLFFALALAVAADQHQLVYVGYDHVLDYNPATGNIRAFDIRRHLPHNDTCDYFVYPPLIEKSSFIDVMTAAAPTSNVQLSYLGNERFLVQDVDTGRYTIRYCSGFMPQQTKIPCEVWAVGHDPAFTEGNRYFYAGANRMIRYNETTKAFDILFYDSDVHGGGFPFGSQPLLSGEFSSFGDAPVVNFAYIRTQVSGVDLLLAQDEVSGKFKVWRFNSNTNNINDTFHELTLSGTLIPKYRISTLEENSVLAYDPSNGDFEVWQFEIVDGKVQIVVQKRDSVDNGHGCIFADRQTCIAHKTCGWCADSVTCHQLNNSRLPCDGTPCDLIVDEYSSNDKKYQRYESPNPSSLKIFGEQPADNPVSPLRSMDKHSASPITRSGDLQDEKILDGYRVNPSEGIVYVPPRSAAIPCMDNEYVDPRDVPAPDVKAEEKNMNLAVGAYVAPEPLSPSGDLVDQRDSSDCDDLHVIAIKNVTKRSSPNANYTSVVHAKNEKLEIVPENYNANVSGSVDFKPSNLGFAPEDDLMNGVRSTYSSLMAKGDDLVVKKVGETDPPAPPTQEMQDEMDFKPRETKPKRTVSKPPSVMSLQPSISPFSNNLMNSGVSIDRPIDLGPDARPTYVQSNAMANAQFQSSSIYSPPSVPATQLTLEHIADLTGKEKVNEPSIGVRDDENVVEGWDVGTVKIEDVQAEPTLSKVLGDGVIAPEPENPTKPLKQQFDAQQTAEALVKVAETKALASQQGIKVKASELVVPTPIPAAVA